MRGLSIVVAVVSALVTILLGAATIYVAHQEIEAQIDHRIAMEMDGLLAFHEDHGFDRLVALIRARAAGRAGLAASGGVKGMWGDAVGVAIADAAGRRRAGTLIATIPPTGSFEFMPIRRTDGSEGLAQALSRPLPGGGQIVVAGDRAALNAVDRRLIGLFAVGLALIVVTGVIATIGFGRMVRRRLALISGTAQAIVEGDFTKRVPRDGSGSEFERLAVILNAMLDRITGLMTNLRQISGDIAHDMRTPLNHLRIRFEQLAAIEPRPEMRAELERSIADIDDLLDLFAAVLGVSEVEGFAARRRFQPIALDAVIASMADVYQPAFAEDGRVLVTELAPVTINGDAQLIGRAVANLLDNILTHTPAGTAARIGLAVGGEGGAAVHALLCVADDGPGVPATAADSLFERFTRLDAARAPPGHGLGLSMVRAIARAHHGDASITRTSPGLTITLSLPMLREDAPASSGDDPFSRLTDGTLSRAIHWQQRVAGE